MNFANEIYVQKALGTNSGGGDNVKNNWLLRLLGVTIIGLLTLWLVKLVLFPTGFSAQINLGNNYGGGSMNMGINYGAAGTVSFLLLLLIKVLFVLFVILSESIYLC
jgi:hypothetical protein